MMYDGGISWRWGIITWLKGDVDWKYANIVNIGDTQADCLMYRFHVLNSLSL